jgi:hypothetical protein
MKIPAESLTQTFSLATTNGANVEFPGGKNFLINLTL